MSCKALVDTVKNIDLGHPTQPIPNSFEYSAHRIALESEHINDWKLPNESDDGYKKVIMPPFEQRVKDSLKINLVDHSRKNRFNDYFYDPPLRNSISIILTCTKCNGFIIQKFVKLTKKQQGSIQADQDYFSYSACKCGKCHFLGVKETRHSGRYSYEIPYSTDEILNAFDISPMNVKDGKYPSLYLLDNIGRIIQNNRPGKRAEKAIEVLYKRFEVLPFRSMPHDNVHRNKQGYLKWKLKKIKHLKDFVEREKQNFESRNWDKFGSLIDSYSKEQYQEILKRDWEKEESNIMENMNNPIVTGFNSTLNLTKFVFEKFEQYREDTKHLRTFIIGATQENKKIAFECHSRYTPEYVKELLNFFQPINEEEEIILPATNNRPEELLDLTQSVLLTLTIDPEKVNQEKAWENITKEWNRFKTRLFQVVGPLQYIIVVECQPGSKYPHIHVVFFGVDWLLLNGTWDEYRKIKKRNKYPTLQNLWKLGFTWVNRTSKNTRVREPLSYMLKYIKNTWGEKEPTEKAYLTQAFLWFFNRRSFNISRRLETWLADQQRIQDLDGDIYKPGEITWLGISQIQDKEKKILSNSDIFELLELKNKPPPNFNFNFNKDIQDGVYIHLAGWVV